MSECYNTIIKNAQNYLKASESLINTDQIINAFEISEVLEIVLKIPKEKIVEDIILK